MGGPWFEVLRGACEEACRAVDVPFEVDVALFYLARWCQKKSGEMEPRVDQRELREAAEKIARNLTADSTTVERLVDGDAVAWTDLRRLLLASARRRGGDRADEYADEALQKIAVVLLTGTAPSRAAERLREGIEGPRNEYVFHAPFSNWARTVVINLIVDEQRRSARDRRPRPVRAPREGGPHLDHALREKARDALPGLLEAIRELPPVQRSALVLSLWRRDLDRMVVDRLHEIAPDLFSGAGSRLLSSDHEIADRLGTTPRRVAASRSVARRKLARRDPLWELLLDVLLPHRSTRPIAGATATAVGRAASDA